MTARLEPDPQHTYDVCHCGRRLRAGERCVETYDGHKRRPTCPDCGGRRIVRYAPSVGIIGPGDECKTCGWFQADDDAPSTTARGSGRRSNE